MKSWIAVAAAVGLVLLIANQSAALLELVDPDDDGAGESIPDAPLDPDTGLPQLEATQGTGDALDVLGALAVLNPVALLSTPSDANRAACLSMLRYSEGTASSDGYRMMFGGDLFNDFSDHPRIVHRYGNLWTSAAGAYQFMAISPIPGGGSTKVDTWDRLQASLSLPDFSPASQDAAALELIRQCGALPDVDAGRIDVAIGKIRRIWASLPGAGYGQGERSLASLESAFTNAGGVIAS